MRDRIADLGTVEVALVTFTDADSLAAYRDARDLGFPVLRDPTRAGYAAFGFGRASFARTWGLRAARRYAQLIREGAWRDLRRPVEDTRQLGGDVVIDARGNVSWIHRGAGPDDRPSVDQIVAAVDVARSAVA
ncbi:MAG: peroxiredoxin-like family protein [Actinomycetota bacterium]